MENDQAQAAPPPPSVFDTMRESIRADAAKETGKEIYAQIEAKKKAIRDNIPEDGQEADKKKKSSNQGGFWDFLGNIGGFLKSLLFKFAEFMDKTFGTNLVGLGAKMMGIAIPSDKEITNVSTVVSDAVSKTVMPETPEATEALKKMTPDELAAATQSNVLAALKANKSAYPSFNDEQLAEMAAKAAAKAKANHGQLQAFLGTENMIAAGLNTEKSLVAQMLGHKNPDELNQQAIPTIAKIVTPAIQRAAIDPNFKQLGSDTYGALSANIEAELLKNDQALKDAGVTLDDASRKVLAGRLSQKAVPMIFKDSSAPEIPQEFLTEQSVSEKSLTANLIQANISDSLLKKKDDLTLMANWGIDKRHTDAIGSAVAPALAPYVENPDALHSLAKTQGAYTYGYVSDAVFENLKASRGKEHFPGQEQLNDAELRVLADQVAVQFVYERMGSESPELKGSWQYDRMKQNHLSMLTQQNGNSNDVGTSWAGFFSALSSHGFSVNQDVVKQLTKQAVAETLNDPSYYSQSEEGKKAMLRSNINEALMKNKEHTNLNDNIAIKDVTAGIVDNLYPTLPQLDLAFKLPEKPVSNSAPQSDIAETNKAEHGKTSAAAPVDPAIKEAYAKLNPSQPLTGYAVGAPFTPSANSVESSGPAIT